VRIEKHTLSVYAINIYYDSIVGWELRLGYIEGDCLRCSDCKHRYSKGYVECRCFCHRIH